MNNDFSSLDKLMEFCMGVNIAKQMNDTVNDSLINLRKPVLQNPDSCVSQEKTYYVIANGQQAGPLNTEALTGFICNKIIKRDTLMWTPGIQTWVFAEEIPEVNKLFLLVPPELPQK